MNLLLNDKFVPITKEIGFLESDLRFVANTFDLWETEILRPLGMRLELNDIEGDLELVLRSLLPLTTPIRCRYAFVSTRSRWTAYFDNGATGTDAAGVVAVMSKKLNCRGVRAVYVPNTMPSRPTRQTKGRFGSTILEVFGADGNPVRMVYAANDGGKWRFGEKGVPFSFEETDKYTTNPISNRFTGEMLDRYLNRLGITAVFDETFYAPSHSILATRHGNLPHNLKEISL